MTEASNEDDEAIAEAIGQAIGQAILDGFVVEPEPGRYQLTAAGQAHVESMLAESPEARAFLEELRSTPINDNRETPHGA